MQSTENREKWGVGGWRKGTKEGQGGERVMSREEIRNLTKVTKTQLYTLHVGLGNKICCPFQLISPTDLPYACERKGEREEREKAESGNMEQQAPVCVLPYVEDACFKDLINSFRTSAPCKPD